MKRNKIKHLLLIGLMLLPAIPLSAQIFESVFKKAGSQFPYFYDDVNNDGKLEYIWSSGEKMQWYSIDAL